MTVSPGSGGGNTVFNLLEPAPAGSEVLYATPGGYPPHWAPFPEVADRVCSFAVPRWFQLPGGNRLALMRIANRGGRCIHAAWARHAVVRQLLHHVRRCAIEVLLLCPQSMLDVTAGLALMEKTGLPAVAWFMDDYYSGVSAGKAVGQLWAQAARRFVISEAMRERYSRLYEAECEVLNNAVPVPSPKPPLAHGMPLRIAYAGATHSYYLDTLSTVLHELAGLEGQAELDIYTHEEIPPALAGNGCLPCHRRPVLPCKKLIERLSNYDVLLLLSSFKPEHRPIAETSLASKVADYLASGRCILVFGPSYAENVRYAQRHGFAEVATTPEDLRPTLLRLLQDPGRRRALGERAWEFARQKHDRRQNYARLWRALCESHAAAASKGADAA